MGVAAGRVEVADVQCVQLFGKPLAEIVLTGYLPLRFLAGSDTVSRHKFMWSDMVKRDIGTPDTVRRIIHSALEIEALWPGQSYRLADGSRKDTNCYWGSEQNRQMVRKGCDELGVEKLYELAVAGYLLGTDFSRASSTQQDPKLLPFIQQFACPIIRKDNDGRSQLEGELMRYWAQQKSILCPDTVAVDERIVFDYCARNHLQEFKDAFMQRLEQLASLK